MSDQIEEIRVAFADALAVIDGLHTDPYIVEGVRPPHAMIDYRVAYDLTFGGAGPDAYEFTVKVYALRASAEQSQKLFDGLRDPRNLKSIKYVLQNDAHLASLIDYVRVVDADDVVVVTVGNADYLMCSFNCEVVF